MRQGDDIAVIIVAGGSGSRMGSEMPKQFLPLCGKPVLVHTVARFAGALPGARIIVVLPAGHVEYWNGIAAQYGVSECCTVCAGGGTRFESVKNGLRLAEDRALIAVHDGVRPMVSDRLIHRVMDTARKYGSAIPAVEPADSFREIADDGRSRIVDRSRLRMIQTPQVFRARLLIEAYDGACREDFTDDASVVEASGVEICLCEGDPQNIKITRPADMVSAEAFLKS